MPDSKSSTSLVRHHDDKKSSGSSRRHDDKKASGSSRHDDNDKYGSSSRDGGHRGRGHDGGRHQHSHQQGRFLPCSFYTLQLRFLETLCGIFKVSDIKVRDWCDEEYIRIDSTKDPRETAFIYNIDPLRQVVSKQDWEKWEKVERTAKNEAAIAQYYRSKGIDIEDLRAKEKDEEDDDDDSD